MDSSACAAFHCTNNNNNNKLICYRSPSGLLHDFLKIFNRVLDTLYKANARIIVCGDFNCDSYQPSNSYKELLYVVQSFELNNIVKWPTRVCNTCVSTLDHIFILCRSLWGGKLCLG